MRSEEETDRAIELYGDTVKRICMLNLKNQADTEDIFQNVFIKYLLRGEPFESAAHERAWIIRVTVNECKDLLKSFFRAKTAPLSEELTAADDTEKRELLYALGGLKEKYRTVLYLHYFEGYSAAEIGKLTGKGENTVYTRLARGRRLLAERLGEE